MDDTALLQAHLEDLARRAQKTGMAHSKFLTAGEAAEAQRYFARRSDVILQLDGGFPGAERQVAVFTQPDWGHYEPEEVLAALRLSFRAQDTLRHPDILGAALGLGLSRDVLGDIHVAPGAAHLVCLSSIADFIASDLAKAGRVGLRAARVPLAQLPNLSPALREKQATVASLRLDALVAEAFNWPRSTAAEAILGGNVQLNHSECLSASKPVEAGDILSVRGKGRVKLLAAGELSRKGRQRITLGFYE